MTLGKHVLVDNARLIIQCSNVFHANLQKHYSYGTIALIKCNFLWSLATILLYIRISKWKYVYFEKTLNAHCPYWILTVGIDPVVYLYNKVT